MVGQGNRLTSIWDLITPRVASASEIRRFVADMAKAANVVTKWYTRSRAWVADASIQPKQILELELEPDEDEPHADALMILGSVAEVKGAADSNGQTLEMNFIACNEDTTEERLRGMKMLVHLCCKKKCPVTDAGMVHPVRWRRLTVSTLTKADWLGTKMPDVLVQLKQKQVRGSLAASVTGPQEGYMPPFNPGARPEAAPAEEAKPLASLLKVGSQIAPRRVEN